MEREMENGLDVRYLKFIDIDAEIEAQRKAEQEAQAAAARKKPAQDAQAAPARQRTAQSSETAPARRKPAQSSSAAPARKRPAQSSGTAPARKRPAQSAQGAPAKKRPAQSSHSAPARKKPVHSGSGTSQESLAAYVRRMIAPMKEDETESDDIASVKVTGLNACSGVEVQVRYTDGAEPKTVAVEMKKGADGKSWIGTFDKTLPEAVHAPVPAPAESPAEEPALADNVPEPEAQEPEEQPGPIGEKTTIAAKKTSADAAETRKRSASAPAKKKKKRESRFKKGLRTYVFILAVLIIAVIVFLWVLMFRYQHNQDAAEKAKTAPQDAFEEWYAEMTPESWAQAWIDQNPETVETLSSVEAYMETRFGGSDVAVYKDRNYSDDAPVFSVWNDDSELATVTLARESEKKNADWIVSEVNVAAQTQSATITVPAGCSVSCGGVLLDEADAVPAESLIDEESAGVSLVNPVSWVTYTVSYISTDPDIEITGSSDYDLYTDEDGQSYFCLTDGQSYQDTAENFVRTYLNYYMQGKNNTYNNMYAALAYVAENSQAYSNLTTSTDGVIWDSYHANIQIDAQPGQVLVWADNCYSVDVTYTASGNVGQNYELDEYAATMRVFFTEVDGSFAITNYETL